MLKDEFQILPIWLDEDFQVCNICGKILISDADIQATTVKTTVGYCKLCGMPIEGRSRFCSLLCEGKFKRFVKDRNQVG